jgi:hypothetical protein
MARWAVDVDVDVENSWVLIDRMGICFVVGVFAWHKVNSRLDCICRFVVVALLILLIVVVVGLGGWLWLGKLDRVRSP